MTREFRSFSPRYCKRLSLAVLALPFAGAIGGCVIHDAPAPSPNSPVVYEPAPYSAPADQELVQYEPAPEPVVVEYEHDLNPYGHWVGTDYGRCWVPNDRPRDWQPYTVGHWEDTDRGWCWVSEGPETDWGLVTYHYGRWFLDPANGWVWVPGTVWAPAWVAWREGDGYCAWTPLPPQCGEGVNVNTVIIDRYCPPTRYVYCDERYFGEPGGYRHFERNNVTIINRTRNITNITYVDNRVINRGVDVRHVEERSGRRINRVQLAQTENANDARRLHQQGRPVVYAPPVVQRAEREAQPRMRQAMAPRPQRQPAARQPVQAGGRQVEPTPSQQQQQRQQRAQEQQQAARQQQLDNQARLRQQQAGRAQAQEQKREQTQTQERARQEQVQKQQDAVRQQRDAQRQQTLERQQAAHDAQQQRQTERQQAGHDAQQRQAAERDAQRQQAAQRQQGAREAEQQRAADRANAARDAADQQRAARDAQRQRNGANQGQPGPQQ
jgi:hypothetical protein